MSVNKAALADHPAAETQTASAGVVPAPPGAVEISSSAAPGAGSLAGDLLELSKMRVNLLALVTVFAGFALGLAGFAANRDQSPESLWAILALLTLAPATIMLAIAVAARFYHLDAETHARIVSELKQRGHLS